MKSKYPKRARGASAPRVPLGEDYAITIEVKRVSGETWVRALLDGNDTPDVESGAALIARVLPGLSGFVCKHYRAGGD
ncbi:MAG TPA: hypothetical protein VFV33_21935 [Gemmatimonadaceae bacterium]|nr:hypothetical protein [Gemmatimonadaceae bacterium]